MAASRPDQYVQRKSLRRMVSTSTWWSDRILNMRLENCAPMYEFAWHSPQLGDRPGAAHGVEIPFVFDTLGLGTQALLEPTPQQSLADAMHGAWVAFAVHGNRGWPNYDITRGSTMRRRHGIGRHRRSVGRETRPLEPCTLARCAAALPTASPAACLSAS